MELTEFLVARLDEDEKRAKGWAEPGGSHWPWLETRILREVEAKRAILEEHSPGYPTTYPEPSGQPFCGVCHSGGMDWDPQDWPCPTVRALGAVYSDHPGYRDEWKP